MKKRYPRVVLAGRINTGKSTLFNTLSETGQAIVSPIPGTTRDLNFSNLTWRNTTFTLVDSGGLDAGYLGQIEIYVQAKARQAIVQADLVLLLVDGRQELSAEDRKTARWLKKSRKKVILVINKIDGSRLRERISPDFYKLGFGQNIPVSALNGPGTGDLLDLIVSQLPARQIPEKKIDLRLSIIGKTNVGKSSLLNAILGTERMIVTPHPHTTREPQDTEIFWREKNILMVDTAGLRKNKNKADEIEKISADKTQRVIKKSDISLIVIDLFQPLSGQDQRIASLALQNYNGIVIVANKWDLIKDKSQIKIRQLTANFRRFFPQLWWAPIIFVSALHKDRLGRILSLALGIKREREKKISEPDLSCLLKEIQPKIAKPSRGKKPATLERLKQIGIDPPAFELSSRYPSRINVAYLRLLEKKIRSRFGFLGTPLKINLQKKSA